MILNSTQRQYKSGFTLIEVVVAITILMLTVTAPLTLISQSLKTSFLARDQITAFYLAYEGIELFRMQRYSNYLRGDPDDARLDDCFGAEGCRIFPKILVGSGQYGAAIWPCVGGCVNIRLQSINGRYGYGVAEYPIETKFKRTIRATLSADERRVTSEVTWDGATKPIIVEAVMYDWVE